MSTPQYRAPLRVVMLAPFGIRPKGTLQARMLPLAQALQQRGHHIEIIAPPVHNPQDANTRVVHGGVSVTHTAHTAQHEPLATLHYTRMLWHATRAYRPELLYLFKPKGYSGLAARLYQRSHPTTPLVVDTDDWEGAGGWNDVLPYPAAAKRLFAWQEYDLPRHAAAVTVASHTLQSLVWSMGVAPQRVFRVPNGIAAAQIAHTPHRTPDPDCLLLYTRFWEFPVTDVIAALVALVQHRPTVRLLVIGKGERGEEHQLQAAAQQAGIAHALDYRGWTDPADLPALFATAAAALVPLDDTLINRARCSAKLLELMAAGIPVIAAQVGEVPTFLTHNHSGILVPPGNPAALARAALALLAAPAQQYQLAQQARAALAAVTWESIAGTVEHAWGTARP